MFRLLASHTRGVGGSQYRNSHYKDKTVSWLSHPYAKKDSFYVKIGPSFIKWALIGSYDLTMSLYQCIIDTGYSLLMDWEPVMKYAFTKEENIIANTDWLFVSYCVQFYIGKTIIQSWNHIMPSLVKQHCTMGTRYNAVQHFIGYHTPLQWW